MSGAAPLTPAKATSRGNGRPSSSPAPKPVLSPGRARLLRLLHRAQASEKTPLSLAQINKLLGRA